MKPVEEEEKEEDFFESISFKEKRAMYVKGFVQLTTFFIFLGVFTATVLASQSIEQSQLASHVTQLFTVGNGNSDSYPLKNVRSIDDYWSFIETTFLPAVFPNPEEGDIALALDMNQLLLPIDLNNRILGSMMIWQVRVQRKEACQVGQLFQNYNTNCFQPLLDYTQDTEPYGPPPAGDPRADAATRLLSDAEAAAAANGDDGDDGAAPGEAPPVVGIYKYSEEPQGFVDYAGVLGTYPIMGHAELIVPNVTAATTKIARLKQDDWISASTRAVFIDFTVWNMNLNLHAVIRIVAEFSRSGVCETNTRVIVVQPRHLYPLSTSGIWDMLSIVGEFILALFILFYIAEEMTELSITWHKYFLDPWNVVDWINLTLLIIFVGVRVMIYIESIYLPALGAQELRNPDHYTPMQSVAERLLLTRTINAFNSVLIWTKVVKYVGFMPYVKTLLTTLETCWRQYLSFLFMFLVIFLAFVIAYTVGFGETIRDLSGVGSTSVYLARSFLGDIDLTPVYHEAPFFGAILILFFMLGIYFLMMNVFFAIILSALDEAKDKKVQDFRQEMLMQSLTQLKQTVRNAFSLEAKIRALVPGLWRSGTRRRG
jgi:polycystin 1L2